MNQSERRQILIRSLLRDRPECQKIAISHGSDEQSMQKHSHLNTIIVALESTSVYSIHIANFLSSYELLMPYKPYVYCLNPKMTANYRKSYVGMKKTDDMDAFLISDFARAGRTKKCEPWRDDSGDFVSEDNRISKTGNTYLRYYLGEAANNVRRMVTELPITFFRR